MKYLIRIHLLMVVFFFTSITLADSAEWLGDYVGSEIPGYEILKSNMMLAKTDGGPTRDIAPDSIDLLNQCKRKGGRALVNVRLIYSLGEVSGEDKSGKMKVVSPGAFFAAYGDCVYEVKPKK